MSYDPYVNILTVDASGVRLADLPANPVITSIHPIFASQGRDNKCLPFGSLSAVLAEYGEDMLNPIMYDQQGLNVKQVVSGGGVAYVCRLMPTNAKKASIVLQVHVKEEADMPVYQRNTFGSFFLDEHGNKVPLMQEIENKEGEPESVPVVKDGYKIKLVAVESQGNNMDSVVKTSTDGQWKIFPLFKFETIVRGACGNKKGFAITNDYRRDGSVGDGRRYELTFYNVSNKGVIESEAISYFFAFNPEATVSADSDLAEGFHMVYDNMDPNNFYDLRPIQLEYWYDNYNALIDLLHTRVEVAKATDIDFITCTDKDVNEYDNLIMDDDSIDMREKVVFLEGGHDGSLQIGNRVQGTDGEITVTEDIVKETRKDLLHKFFNGKIDDELTDCRLVGCGVVFDANYDMTTKISMASDLPKIREDIFVFLDCGFPANYEEAIRIANDIRSRLDTSVAQHAIYPHGGICVNQRVRYKVTHTYEMAYMYANIYKTVKPYCLVSGFNTGRVQTMLPDFTVQGELAIKRVKAAQLNFITKLSNTGNGSANANGLRPLYVMDENTQYSAPLGNSVMLSVRNALVITDLKRLCRTILPKYSFQENAEVAMSDAKLELMNNIQTRYPSDILFEPNFYQTERDKVLETCSVDIVVRFPGIIKTWNVTITAKRVGQE